MLEYKLSEVAVNEIHQDDEALVPRKLHHRCIQVRRNNAHADFLLLPSQEVQARWLSRLRAPLATV